MPYVGRFAPSPTGPLHFGSLLAAVASYLEALTHQGRWLVRIEDIDPPREQAGADTAILTALEDYGFEWHGPATFQSRSRARQELLVDRLSDAGYTYPCSCSRRDLANVRRGPLGAIYPGTCRDGCDSTDVAVRVRTDNDPVTFTDRLQGPQASRLEEESGDFVILRRDGFIAYHLAVVADDHDQGITEVVRGVDLLDSTPRQIYLQRLLALPSPAYLHIPIVVNDDGSKLSKLTGAPAIPTRDSGPVLVAALGALGQQPPPSLAHAAVAEIWQWARECWNVGVMAGQKRIPSGQHPMAEAKNPLS